MTDERAYQIHVWGLLDNMRRAQDRVDAILAGFRIRPPGLVAELDEDGFHRDFRFGYAFHAPGPDWQFRDLTPQEIAAVGSLKSWSAGKQKVMIMAFNVFQVSQDEQWFFEFMKKIILVDKTGTFGWGEPSRTTATLGGLPCQRLAWRRSDPLGIFLQRFRRVMLPLPGNSRMSSKELFLVRRDQTFFGVVVTTEPLTGWLPSSSPDQLLTGFSFLD